MKSSKIKAAAILLISVFTFAGCGDSLYTMTPEEESAIVSYASQIVAKYNGFQQDGEIYVSQEDLEGEEETEEPARQELPGEGSTEVVALPDDMQAADVSPKGYVSDIGEGTEGTVGEALSLGNIHADYTGSSLCTSYEKSDAYAVDAENGKQLLVLNIKLANQTEQNINVDLLTAKPIFQAIVNETETVPAQMTILSNDLSTYKGEIAAGTSVDTVLLFQVSQEIKEVTSVQLKITVGSERYIINIM